jgi:hypothetical protein
MRFDALGVDRAILAFDTIAGQPWIGAMAAGVRTWLPNEGSSSTRVEAVIVMINLLPARGSAGDASALGSRLPDAGSPSARPVQALRLNP